MTDITIADLTEGTPSGAGAFDTLMAAVKGHLEQEYTSTRITGREYADVYLGSMQSVLQMSVQFALENQRAARQAELLASQTLKTDEETLLVIKERGKVVEETANIVTARDNMIRERSKIDAEIDILHAQENNLKAEGVLTNQRTKNMAAENESIHLQQNKISAEVKLVNEQVKVTSAEIRKTDAEVELLNQQILNAIEQISKSQAETALLGARKLTEDEQPAKVQAEVLFTTQRTANLVKEGNVLDKQIEKYTAEIGILEQKVFTEEAQTKDIVNGTAVGGILGKQMLLYTNQADGFIRDAEQKAAKLFADIYNVTLSTDPGAANPDVSKVDSTNIGQVMTKLASGVGINLT